MSLNDYFAANGAVYLRPMGLPDCFSMPGLPPGLKPPPMPPLQQKPRTMAAVSPLHQPPMTPYDSSFNAAASRNTTSSFAAALRKLAKQAGDPVSGDKDPTQISPVSSPSLSQGGALTPKRNAPNSGGGGPPPMFLTNHQVSYGSSSPPVVTIAPSRPVATHTSESRKVMDLSSVQQANNPNPISNGHLQEAMGVKMDTTKGLPRPAHSEKWDETTLAGKGLSVSSASSQVRPHATIAPLPRPDDSVTSSRGFQPYRGGSEESRNTLPHHMSLFEHHHPAASYPYTPAFLPPPHLSHPAYRFDDPLYLERYSLLRPPMMQYAQPSMMGPPAFYPNSRYAADLIAHSISNSNMLNHERLKAAEEERRLREKEMELDQSRMKDQERQREREHKEQREKERRERSTHNREKEEHYEHRKSSATYSSSSKRTESPNVRTTPVIHNTPNHIPAPTAVSSSIPLNLVLQPPPHGEPQKKEAELWMPWQQPTISNHPKEESNSSKHPAFRSQDGHRHHQTRENHMNDKSNLRFSPSSMTEKKHHPNIPIIDPTAGDSNKKHSTSSDILHRTLDPANRTSEIPHRTSEIPHRTSDIPHRTPDNKRTFEHNHVSEPSAVKDSGPHEWRHEKLQKACTNIHRKSHESSKKAKEERFQNHHRKMAVNGAVLKPAPVTYQNEGMHARLLESEKCRLEMNGHTLPKPIAVNSSNDRLVVPSYKSGHLPIKDLFSQKSYAEYFGSSLLKSSVELPPVISKLDIELKRLRKGEKMCVDDEKEERRLKNLLIIAKMPSLKLDSNPHKLNFLRLFGLTTHLKKKKIEFDMFLKRRKRLRLDSALTPPDSIETSREELSPVLERKNLFEVECLAERLRQEESTNEKTEFLLKFNLKPITPDKREEQERFRRRVSEEKIRRHYRLLASVNRKSSPKRLFVPKSEAVQRLDQLKKLTEMNSIPNGLLSKRLDEDEEMNEVKYNPSSQAVSPKVEQVPYNLMSESSVSSSSSSKSFYSSVPKSLNKYSFKRGHSLKREFRFVSPQSNYKSNPEGMTNGLPSSQSPCTNSAKRSCSVSTQVDATQLTSGIDKCLTDLKSSANLSGTIETIMEVIYRHQTEQSSEKTVLSERCQQLRATQEELKKQADALSRQMSDLLKSKRELDDDRQTHQNAINHLKKCLQLGR